MLSGYPDSSSVSQFFNEDVLEVDKYRLSDLSSYYIPPEAPLHAYRDFIRMELPDQDKPEAFGQHPNADISAQMEESNDILQTLLNLQPRIVSGQAGNTREAVVLDLADDIIDKVFTIPSLSLCCTSWARRGFLPQCFFVLRVLMDQLPLPHSLCSFPSPLTWKPLQRLFQRMAPP